MILPTTFEAGVLLLVLSMVCWGSWAATYKMAGKWRFELYYYDFSVGIALGAAAAAFTFGSFNSSELTFQDNLLIAAYRKIAFALGAGLVFNLGNLLLAGAVSITGLSVAFPVCLGTALIATAIREFALNPQGSMALMLGGAVLVAGAIVVDAYAHVTHADAQAEQAKKAALQIDPRSKPSKHKVKPPGPARAIVLSVIGGLLVAAAHPLLNEGRLGDNGVGPYGTMLLLAAGVLVSTFLYAPFFVNFPVAGEPIQSSAYFKGTARQHLLGLLGGVLVAVAGAAGLAGATVPTLAKIGPILTSLPLHAGAILAAIWGLLVWREFKGSQERARMLLWVALVLYLAGLGMVAIAPLYS